VVVGGCLAELQASVAEVEVGVAHDAAQLGGAHQPRTEYRAVELDRATRIRECDERGDGRVAVRDTVGRVGARDASRVGHAVHVMDAMSAPS
jgi:hypothetical protein